MSSPARMEAGRRRTQYLLNGDSLISVGIALRRIMKTRMMWALVGAFLLSGQTAPAGEPRRLTRPSAPTPPVNHWLLGCKLMILSTDTVATAEQMQRELDDALHSEPCQRAVAEISLASRIRVIRDEIRKLKAFESDDVAGL